MYVDIWSVTNKGCCIDVYCNCFIHAGKSENIGTQISFQGNQAVVPFTAMQNFILNITGKASCGVDNTIGSRWYHNGRSLQFGLRLGRLKRSPLNISQSLILKNLSVLDEGTYDALLTVDPYTHFVSHLGCHSNYYTFVASTVGAVDIILAQEKLQLKYYGVFISVVHYHICIMYFISLYFLLQSTL